MSLLTIGDQFPAYRLTALIGGDLSKVMRFAQTAGVDHRSLALPLGMRYAAAYWIVQLGAGLLAALVARTVVAPVQLATVMYRYTPTSTDQHLRRPHK